MKSKHKAGLLILLLLVLTLTIVINTNMRLKAENQALSKAVFKVAWYDVSEEVLDGLKGVERVYSHMVGSTEAHTVYYDPTLINVEKMENALKDGAGYLETVYWS